MKIDATTVRIELEERSIEPGDAPSLFVNVLALPALGLDRDHFFGWSVGKASEKKSRALAERLKAAVLAGAVFAGEVESRKDVNGRTFLSSTGCCRVMGRRLNADLARLGF